MFTIMNNLTRWICCSLVAGLWVTTAIATELPHQAARVGDTIASTSETLVTLTGEQTHVVTHDGATFIKLHLAGINLADNSVIVISDGEGNFRSTISSREIADDGGAWAHEVDGDTAVIRVEVTGVGSSQASASFTVDSYGAGTVPITLDEMTESVWGSDDRKDRECFPGTTKYHEAKSVGRMLYTSDTGGQFVCTGSLISPDNHFLTNNHCTNTETEVDSLTVRFNYEYTSCGGSTDKTFVTFGSASNHMIRTSTGLDYTLLTLAGNPAQTYGYLPLNGEDLAGHADKNRKDPLWLPQHPGGNQKVIHARHTGTDGEDCVVKMGDWSEPGSTANSAIQHTCDTAGGSSGSPVLNDNNQIVALHHTGYLGNPSKCSLNGGAGSPCNGAIEIEDILPEISGDLPLAQGGSSSATGWVWKRVKEAWRYKSSNSERMWTNYTTSGSSWVDAGMQPVLAEMMVAAAESGHWFGQYWKTTSKWSNARLWNN